MMSTQYKILYLNSVSFLGGAEKSLLLLLQNINRQHFEPMVVLPESGPLCKRIQALGIKLRLLPLKKIKVRNPVPYLITLWKLVYTLRSYKIDLLHCNMDICNQYGMIAAKLVGIPVITHTRNILGKRAFKRMFLRGANVLIANSRASADSYSQYTSNDQRVEIIYNAVDIEQFCPEGACNSGNIYNISSGEFVIGQIARITPHKGQDVFIRALVQVIEEHPNVRALIVGDTVIDDTDWFLDELKQIVKELGLVDKIIFTGFVEDIVDLYRCLDLVVLPSKSEGFGRTIAEAMAMTKPVVASRVGGLQELILEGETGFLVPPGDNSTLADAICRVIENPKLAFEFGIKGRQRIKEHLSVEKNVKETEQVYQSVLG